MLFNSYIFIFGFLPAVLLVFFLFGRFSRSLAAAWLALASIFFYGWWDVRFVPLFLASIVFNYGVGYALSRQPRKWLLAAGISIDLALLGYFKYANFFVANLESLSGVDFAFQKVILPIGISFFTFTQIAFLVDTYIGKAKEYNFIHYCLFVSYFPHLVAGPVLHHGQMMPQFGKAEIYRFNADNITVGLTIFAIGLFKKAVLADSVSGYATPVFDAAAAGANLFLVESWIGALAYTFQLYFDFSGYSDMAIGLSWMFNIRLPLNFNSPYKATNISDFWRRWHMTLSQFLRDYLYIPLGGNRRGPIRRYANLMITMLLGGLWHGAGWTFVIWGGLHGLYLAVNHAWNATSLAQRVQANGGRLATVAGRGITFLCVVVAWVFFRAQDFPTALYMLEGMVGLHGLSLPEYFRDAPQYQWLTGYGVHFYGLMTTLSGSAGTVAEVLGVLSVVVWLLPNTQELLGKLDPALGKVDAGDAPRMLTWKADWKWAAVTGAFFGMSIVSLTKVSEFLYFQF